MMPQAAPAILGRCRTEAGIEQSHQGTGHLYVLDRGLPWAEHQLARRYFLGVLRGCSCYHLSL
jgi:hypothetical protein